MTKSKPDMMLWLSDARGQYIPRDFANSFINRERDVIGVTADDWRVLENGPDDGSYWDVWNDVCDNAIITDENGELYRIWQDGDCWLVPDGMEWSDRDETFHWPDDDEDECSQGIHSWVDEVGKLPADTKCTRCNEPYGSVPDDEDGPDFVERNGRFTCRHCGYELSAMISEDEIPEHCECQEKEPNDPPGWEGGFADNH